MPDTDGVCRVEETEEGAQGLERRLPIVEKVIGDGQDKCHPESCQVGRD